MTESPMDASDVTAGQVWSLRSAEAEEAGAGIDDGARIVVGAIVEFGSRGRVICCAASTAGEAIAVPFIPLSQDAFSQTVGRAMGRADLPDAFFDEFDAWMADETGKRVFEVPFEGSLDRMIALQMAKIAKIEI